MGDKVSIVSMGRRVMNHGYSFIWLKGKNPVVITPDFQLVALDVVSDIPMITEGGLCETLTESSELEAVTGVRLESGSIRITVEHATASPNYAVPARSRGTEAKAVERDRKPAEKGKGEATVGIPSVQTAVTPSKPEDVKKAKVRKQESDLEDTTAR